VVFEVADEIDTTELTTVLASVRLRAQNVDRDLLGQILLTAIDDVIQSEGTKGAAGAWEPFSPNTRRKRGAMSDAKLLQDTGLLANMQLEQGPDYMDAVSPADYTIRHVEGNDNLPIRDPFDVNQDFMLAEMEQAVMDDIERAIAG
jgi:hypothetical protein